MAVGSPMTTKTLRTSSAWAASRSPCTRSRLRPRVGKCSTVSIPMLRWIRLQTAHGLMRMRAMGLSATLITSAPDFGEQAGAGQQLVGGKSARRVHLYSDDKFSGGQLLRPELGRLRRQAGSLLFRRRACSAQWPACRLAPVWMARAMAAMCWGVVPQQPPITLVPASRRSAHIRQNNPARPGT